MMFDSGFEVLLIQLKQNKISFVSHGVSSSYPSPWWVCYLHVALAPRVSLAKATTCSSHRLLRCTSQLHLFITVPQPLSSTLFSASLQQSRGLASGELEQPWLPRRHDVRWRSHGSLAIGMQAWGNITSLLQRPVVVGNLGPPWCVPLDKSHEQIRDPIFLHVWCRGLSAVVVV